MTAKKISRVAPAMSAEISHSSRWSRILFSMAPPIEMMARSVQLPAILSLNLSRGKAPSGRHRLLHDDDHFLPDAAFRPLPGRLHRDLPSLLLLGREVVELGAAGSLDLLQRV